MALEIERLVDAVVPQMVVQAADDLGARGDRALMMRVDVVDVGRRAADTDSLDLDRPKG